MSRPRTLPPDAPRRLSSPAFLPAEVAEIERAAAADGRTVSSWIRVTLLRATLQPTRDTNARP